MKFKNVFTKMNEKKSRIYSSLNDEGKLLSSSHAITNEKSVEGLYFVCPLILDAFIMIGGYFL
jgi:hypothetical protein